jgi:hypothetical protein
MWQGLNTHAHTRSCLEFLYIYNYQKPFSSLIGKEVDITYNLYQPCELPLVLSPWSLAKGSGSLRRPTQINSGCQVGRFESGGGSRLESQHPCTHSLASAKCVGRLGWVSAGLRRSKASTRRVQRGLAVKPESSPSHKLGMNLSTDPRLLD